MACHRQARWRQSVLTVALPPRTAPLGVSSTRPIGPVAAPPRAAVRGPRTLLTRGGPGSPPGDGDTVTNAAGRGGAQASTSVLQALAPALVGLVLAYLLKLLELEALNPLAQFMVAGAVIVTGRPILRRSQQFDRRHPGAVATATVVVGTTVGAATLWVIDVAAALFALGALSAFVSVALELETFFLSQAIISLPLVLAGAYLFARWAVRRSVGLATRALTPTVVLYVLVTVLANVLLWRGDRGVAATDVLYPIVAGPMVWWACRKGLRHAD